MNETTYFTPSPKDVAALREAILEATSPSDMPELNSTQKLRLVAASALVKHSEIALDFDDPEEFGKILAELAGFTLWGSDYQSKSRER